MNLAAIWAAFLALLAQLFPTFKAEDGDGVAVRFPVLKAIEALLALWPLPSLTDKIGCRAWLGKAFAILQDFAAQTANTIDDQAVKLLNAGLADNALYDLLWEIFEKMLGQEGGLVMSDAEVFNKASIVGAAVGIDPATIIALIGAIVQIINLFRNRA